MLVSLNPQTLNCAIQYFSSQSQDSFSKKSKDSTSSIIIVLPNCNSLLIQL